MVAFPDKPVHPTDAQNALFTTMAVLVALALANVGVLAAFTGFMVMTTQIVTGANLADTVRMRFVHVGRIILVLAVTAAVASVVRPTLWSSIVGLILLAFSFGYWRQYYPHNFKDINVPSGVVFFLTLTTTGYAAPLVGVAIGGSLALISHLLIALYVVHRPAFMDDLKGLQKVFGQKEVPLVDETLYTPGHNFLRLNPELIKYCLQLSILLVIGMLVFKKTGYQHGYWMPFATMIVLQMDRKATGQRLAERMLGTVAGCIAGTAILILHPPQLVLHALLAVSIFLFLFLIRRHYAIGAGFVTVYVMLLIASHAGNPVEVALERIVFTLAGGLLAYLSHFVWRIAGQRSPSTL